MAERRIVGFWQDQEREWIAELECGHSQHVRHSPPWQVRPWVLTAEGRAGRLGTLLPCRQCDEIGTADAASEEDALLSESLRGRSAGSRGGSDATIQLRHIQEDK